MKLSLQEYAAEAAEQAADYAAETSEGVFPPFDPTYFTSQLFWLAITFGALYFFLSRWILPQIGNTLEERRDRIADDLDAAAQLKEQADAAVASYEKSLADARAKAHSVAAEAKADMDRKIAEEMKVVDAELNTKQEEAEARIAKSRDKALAEVRNIASEAAIAVVNQVAGLEIKKADADKAVKAVEG